MKNRWEIAIVGGTGGMGQLFANELKSYANITIISRSSEKAKRIAEKLGAQAGLLKDCNTADITIISVPIENTYETSQKLFKIVKPGSLIIDVSAVKTHIEKIKSEIPEQISYISMHPLFGPEGSFRDNNVILIPLKEDKWLREIQEILKNLGTVITIATAEEHDLVMSKIQVVHHFMYLMLAFYLSNTQISKKFFTRLFRKTLENLQGIEKNLNTILEIQKENPNAESARKEINSLIKDFISFDQESKIKELIRKIEVFKRNYLIKKNEI